MIDTLANVKSLLTVTVNTDDTLLSKLMDGADAYIAQTTGREFDGGTFTETHDGGFNLVFLRNFPVTSITSVKVDPRRAFGAETLRDPTSYISVLERGMLYSIGGMFLETPGLARWPGTVQVVYATPTSAVPYPVKEAFGQLVVHWYRLAKTYADQEYQMLLERTAGTDAKVWSWSLASGLKIPSGVWQLLEPYRVPVL